MAVVETRIYDIQEKLKTKKFSKRAYSSNELSKMLKLKGAETCNGHLKQALLRSPEWKKTTGRMWMYVGPQKIDLFNQPQVHNRSTQVQTKPKRREISLFWGLISIK